MGAFTTNASNIVLNWLTGKQNAPNVGARYLAMYSGDPRSGGTELYVRTEVTSKMGSAVGGSITNSQDIQWPRTTNAIGTVTHLALYDASAGGTMLASGPLTSAVVVGSNVTPTIPAGQLVISLP